MDGNNSSQNSPYPQGAGQTSSNPVNPPPVVPSPSPVTPNPYSQTTSAANVPPPPSMGSTSLPQAGSGQAAPPPKEKHSRVNKKVLAVVALLVIGISLPITVFMSRQQQNLEQEAAPKAQIDDQTVVLSVGDEDFSLADVKSVAEEQYSGADLEDKKVWEIARDILAEREILDLSVEDNGISAPTTDEVSAFSELTGLSEKEAYYDLLKQKIVDEEVRHIKAVSVGYWVPPPGFAEEHSNQEQQEIRQQQGVGEPAIDRAESGLTNGQDPLTLAKSLASANPSLSESISVNGYKLSSIADDEDLVAEPEIYEYSDSNFDNATRNLLFAQGVSENRVIRVSANNSNGGEVVYKIVEINNTGSGSYQEWLEEQIRTLPVKKTSL